MVIERQGHDHFLDSSGLWYFVSMNFNKENPVLALHRHSFVVGYS